MKALRTIAGEFQEEDIYNMDETGLYWRMTPSRGLSTQALPGIKKDKTRISIALCVNATGSDRLPLWIIGKARTPRALRGVSLTTMGVHWRHNKKAWMNSTIMVEWLQAFYVHVGSTRDILLTMDNFSAHALALELAPPPSNIRICWLPPNATSRYQPLDQGIIASFKVHYRRQWLAYMLQAFDSDQDPLVTMNIHLAIRWALRSWFYHVTGTTIYNCFRKSTLLVNSISLPVQLEPSGLQQLYEQVIQSGRIHDVMSINSFLNPIEELAEEEEEDITGGGGTETQEELEDRLLQEVIQDELGSHEAKDDDEDEVQAEQPTYSLQAASNALQVLIGFTESREDIQTSYLRLFERFEGQLEALKQNGYSQGTLDSSIT